MNEIIEKTLSDIKSDCHVQKMKDFQQHGCVSTYEHCESVVELSYKINRALHLNSDMDTLLKGALLHDFYLYDWHEEDDGSHQLHGFIHAERACLNAKRYFDVNEKIQHVIWCHMWPLNIRRIPKSREAWIVCVADKYVSVYETLFKR